MTPRLKNRLEAAEAAAIRWRGWLRGPAPAGEVARRELSEAAREVARVAAAEGFEALALAFQALEADTAAPIPSNPREAAWQHVSAAALRENL